MPNYDVRCRTCGSTFEISRPMARADEPAPCPQGHGDTVRLLPAVAVTGRAGSAQACPAGVPSGGCCGGGACGTP